MSAHGFALPCACSLGCSAPPCAPSGRVRPSGARSGVVFREPGPCAACGVSIVSINCQQTIRLLTQESSVHSGNCPFIPFVPSIMSIRASPSHALVSLECGVWRRTGYWSGDWTVDSLVPQSPVWRQSGLVVWRRLICSVDCADAHLRHRTSGMAHRAPRSALRRRRAAGGAGAGGGRRSHITHVRVVSCMVQSLCITS